MQKDQVVTTDVVISEYRKQISFIQEQSQLMSITSQEELDKAGEFLSVVMKVEKTLADRKAEITKPLMAGLASARELFKPLEVDHAEAKKTIKSKMLKYTIEAENERLIAQEKIEKRLEKGTMRIDTAVRKIEELGDKPSTTLRVVTKVRIVDEDLVPREYMTPNLTKITEAVLKQKLTITGVETYEEKSIVGSTR